jgi:2-polyprenyl-3-methyl-5-hydroxy-6-metoxy-1,4-benzoquinol methylase
MGKKIVGLRKVNEKTMAGKWRWKAAQFAERKWWQNYLKHKDVTQYLRWKKAYWQNLLEVCQPFFTIKSSDHILDAGCGPAGMFMLFDQQKTTAFDPLIEVYQKDLPHFKRSMYPQVEFVASGLENFYSTQQFDVVFCMNAINHVSDIEKSYDNLVALTKPNAHLVITIDAHNHSFFKKMFRLLPGDILHPHQLDLKEYEAMLTSRGCKIVTSIMLKKEFFFNHYIIIAKRI